MKQGKKRTILFSHEGIYLELDANLTIIKIQILKGKAK